MIKSGNVRLTTPVFVRTAQALFFLNAAIWLLFGIMSLNRITTGSPAQPAAVWAIAILMFGNAVAMLVAGAGIGGSKRLFYGFGIVVLVANIVLTITDQFGWLDLVTLLIDGILLGLLIATRSQYRTAKGWN